MLQMRVYLVLFDPRNTEFVPFAAAQGSAGPLGAALAQGGLEQGVATGGLILALAGRGYLVV